LLGFDRELRADGATGATALGIDMRGSGGRVSIDSTGSMNEEESMDIGEGSTMDLEED